MRSKSQDRIDRPALMAHLRGEFALDWQGIHGAPHWARVRLNGLEICAQNSANPHVIELFSFFHDSKRENEHEDHGHGTRGAQNALALHGRFFEATQEEMALLAEACQGHSDGLRLADRTVQTCWDSDRLDLGRVGYTVDPLRLCTPQAQQPETIARAGARAMAWLRIVRAQDEREAMAWLRP